MTLDPSGLYAATSSSDKTVSLFDFYSGECLAKLYGHSGGWGFLLLNHFRNAHHSSNNFLLSSEVVTQLQFSRDCKYLYSVSGDRFVWLRLSDNSYQSCLLRNTMTSLQNPITSFQNTMTSLQNDMTSLQNDMTSLQNDMTSFQNTIISLLFCSIFLQLYFHMAAIQSTNTGVCYWQQQPCACGHVIQQDNLHTQ